MRIDTSDLALEPVAGKFRNGRQIFRLTKPLIVRFYVGETIITRRIPEGFETERTSYPHWMDRLGFDPKRNVLESVLHDYLYENPHDAFAIMFTVAVATKDHAPKRALFGRITDENVRKFADQSYRVALLRPNHKRFWRICHFIKAWAHYAAVRVFGGKSYRSQSKN